MKTSVLLFLVPFTIFGQDFEDAPVLSAAAILEPEFAVGVTLATRLDPGPLQ